MDNQKTLILWDHWQTIQPLRRSFLDISLDPDRDWGRTENHKSRFFLALHG